MNEYRLSFRVADFTPGVRTDLAPELIPDGATPNCSNVRMARNSLQVRKPTLRYTTAPAAGTNTGLRALLAWVQRGDSDVRRLVAVRGTGIAASDGTDQTFSAELAYAFSVSATNRPRLAQFTDYLYVCDGANAVKKCFLSGLTEDYKWAYTKTNLNPIIPGRLHVRQGDNCLFFVNSTSTAGYEYSSAIPPVQTRVYTGGHHNYNDVTADSTSIYFLDTVGSSHADWGGVTRHIFQYNRTTGALTRAFGVNSALDADGVDRMKTAYAIAVDETNSRLYVICLEDAGVGGHYFVKRYKTTDGTYVDDYLINDTSVSPPLYGDVCQPRDVTVGTDGVYVLDGYSLAGDTLYTAVNLFTKSADTVAPNFVTRFGSYGRADGQWLLGSATSVAVGGSEEHVIVSGVSNGGQVFTRGGTFVLHVGVTGTNDGAVVGSAYLGQRSTDGYVFSDPGSTYLRFYTKTAMATTDYLSLDEPTAPTSPPQASVDTASATSGWMDEGDYEFYYTCDRWMGREWRVGPPSEHSFFHATASAVSTILVTATPGAHTGLWRYSLWLKPPNGTDFWQVSVVYADNLGAAPIGVSWYTAGVVQGDEAVATTYVAMPPVASLMMEWKGRMLYAGPYPDSTNQEHDTLYISAFNDASQCPTIGAPDDPPESGTYIQIGSDGLALTGFGRIGSYALLFKEESVWLLDGDDWMSFRPVQVNQGHGCIAHETIQSVENLTLWLAEDGVWAFDGQTVQELGRPVNALIRAQAMGSASTGTGRRGAWSVYDPDERLYVLTIPSTATATVYPNSTSYVYDLMTGTWTVFANLPDGPMVYAPYATTTTAGPTVTTTPCVFAGERYYDGADTRIFKLWQATDGYDDDHAATNHAIAWTWWDKQRVQPGDVYKDVRSLQAYILQGGPAGQTVTMYIYINGNTSTAATSRALTFPASREIPYKVGWSPRLIADVETYQLVLTGTSTGTALEVGRLDYTLIPKGPIL